MAIENLTPEQIGLISLDTDGTIYQLGLTEEQSMLLQAFIASLSSITPLVRMPKAFDLELKSEKSR